MKTLSIRQPWAWLIIHGGKDIENRTWHTKYRGRFLVHAAHGMTRKEYADAAAFARACGVEVPAFEDLQRGGIIGSVELIDSVNTSLSPWYMGQKGFVLRDPKPIAFCPMRGRLGFFDGPSLINPETICKYQRFTWECRGDGFLWDADCDGFDPSEQDNPCPSCNTLEYLQRAKEEAETTSSWSNGYSSGTGETIWLGSVRLATEENPDGIAEVLRTIGQVNALVDDKASAEGYVVRIHNVKNAEQGKP